MRLQKPKSRHAALPLRKFAKATITTSIPLDMLSALDDVCHRFGAKRTHIIEAALRHYFASIRVQ